MKGHGPQPSTIAIAVHRGFAVAIPRSALLALCHGLGNGWISTEYVSNNVSCTRIVQ